MALATEIVQKPPMQMNWMAEQSEVYNMEQMIMHGLH